MTPLLRAAALLTIIAACGAQTVPPPVVHWAADDKSTPEERQRNFPVRIDIGFAIAAEGMFGEKCTFGGGTWVWDAQRGLAMRADLSFVDLARGRPSRMPQVPPGVYCVHVMDWAPRSRDERFLVARTLVIDAEHADHRYTVVRRRLAGRVEGIPASAESPRLHVGFAGLALAPDAAGAATVDGELRAFDDDRVSVSYRDAALAADGGEAPLVRVTPVEADPAKPIAISLPKVAKGPRVPLTLVIAPADQPASRWLLKTVTIATVDGTLAVTVQPDEQGRAEIVGLPAGPVVLRLDGDGHSTPPLARFDDGRTTRRIELGAEKRVTLAIAPVTAATAMPAPAPAPAAGGGAPEF